MATQPTLAMAATHEDEQLVASVESVLTAMSFLNMLRK
jgi:hypothetical protein